MSYTRKIAHNTAFQIVGKGISTVIGIIVIGMLTRYLGESGFGQYTTVMAFLQLFGVLVDMGLYIILVKKLSEPTADHASIAGNIFTLRFLSAVVFLGLAPLVVLLFPYPSIVKVGVLVTTLSFLGVTLTQALTGIFQRYLRMDRVVIAEIIGRIALIATTYLVIVQQRSLLWILGTVVISSLLNFSVLFAFSRRFVRIRFRFDWPVWRSVIREAWPIALSIAFNLVYFKADTIILSVYYPDAIVGVYGSAYKVLEVLTTFPAMFAGLVLPLLAATWLSNDRERFKRVLQKSFDAMVMVALPLIVGTWFLATPVMALIAPEFAHADTLLRILIFAAATIFIGNLFGNIVVAVNKQRTMMWLYLAVAAVSLAGYFWFIPRYSYYGAAGMTVASELMVTIAASIIVGLSTKVWPRLQVVAKVLAACLGMAVVLFFLTKISWLLALLAGTGTYGVLLVAFRAITPETIREIINRPTNEPSA